MLNKCVFRPELSPLSTERAILKEEAVAASMISPVISPYYKMKGYMHEGSCCEPYQAFNAVIGGSTRAHQNVVFNFIFTDPTLQESGIPLLLASYKQSNLYFVNASKK